MTLDIPFHITCIDPLQSTTVQLIWFTTSIKLSILASYDNVHYFSVDNNQTEFHLKPSQKFYLKTDKPIIIKNDEFRQDISFITLTDGKAAIAGNINSLITSDYSNPDLDLSNKAFKLLFMNFFRTSDYDKCSLVDASELLLPTKKISESCYKRMFSNCHELKYPPKELPAKRVPLGAYQGMFRNCYKLVSIPNILGSEFRRDSCLYMFDSCTYLEDISNFVQEVDYAEYNAFCCMFYDCKRIKYFPKKFYIKTLILTTVDKHCDTMFSVDLPYDYLLSMNYVHFKFVGYGYEYVKGIYYNISSALNNLDYNKFNRKLSVFDFYGLFYKEKQIG